MNKLDRITSILLDKGFHQYGESRTSGNSYMSTCYVERPFCFADDSKIVWVTAHWTEGFEHKATCTVVSDTHETKIKYTA